MAEQVNFDQLVHKMGLKFHDMQRLHVRTKKLNKEQRTAGKYKEIAEEMSEILLSAAAEGNIIRQHSDFPTSGYKEDSFMQR